MPNNPIQVILDRERFHVAKEVRRTPRVGKDFYAHQNDALRDHKYELIEKVERAKSVLKRQGMGYAKITMRGDALAKSHRPYEIFEPEFMPVVGVDDLGEVLIEVSVRGLDAASAKIRKAEETTRMKFDKVKRIEIPFPSREKQEVGAVESFALLGAEDRVKFSAQEAVEWLSDPRTTGSYRVELFRMPPQRSRWDVLSPELLKTYQEFVMGLLAFAGLECERLSSINRYHRWLRIRLSSSKRPAYHPFVTDAASRNDFDESTPFETNIELHEKLIRFLQNSPIVRRVYPSPKLTSSNAEAVTFSSENASLPSRSASAKYPLVAVVDGGLSPILDSWVIDRQQIIAPEHGAPSHGTVIGALLVAAGSMNGPTSVPWERDGCELVDIALCPNEDDVEAASAYGGVDGFLDDLEQSVPKLRTRHGVRIFSISSNTLYAATPEEYSYEAKRLDEIADQNDVIIVQSSGNLGRFARPEWPADDDAARDHLMTLRDPFILKPAESTRNISVSAINQPGVAHRVADAPAAYSRRGPGMRAGVKPDVAHYGGAHGHGLRSIDDNGNPVHVWGTSYAVPQVAKTLAALDSKIEGEVSRETLLALLIHHATIPGPLARKPFLQVARDFVGFGLPTSSKTILNNADSSITLVFAGRLEARMEFSFDFSWPRVLTAPSGACRGHVRMTMVSTPPLNHDYKSEIARINIDPTLLQQNVKGGKTTWKGRPNSYLSAILPQHTGTFEVDRITEGLKWSPSKLYEATFKKGVGKSSLWRLKVDGLARAEEVFPDDGVPFTVILTISDNDGAAAVFNDMRASLTQAGVRLADIQTASRITPRV